MAAGLTLRVGGQWLDTIGWYGEIEVTDRWPGICYTLSWRMDLPTGARPPAMMPHDGQPAPLVEAFVGSAPRWTGRLLDTDWADGEFAAIGLYREAENVLAIDGGGNAINDIGWAMFWASVGYGRGVISWSALESFTPVTEAAATDLNYLAALIDEYAEQNGRRWGVTADRLMFTAEDWVDPQLQVYPSVADLGATSEGQVARVYGRYVNSSTLDYETAIAGPGGAGGMEEAVDLTKYGYLTPAKAQAIVDGYYAQASTTWNFTNGLTLAEGMVTTPGGGVVDMSQVVARKPIRVHGMRDPRTGLAYTDFVIGESIWTPDSDGIVQANPVQMVGRDQEAVLEDVAKGVLAA